MLVRVYVCVSRWWSIVCLSVCFSVSFFFLCAICSICFFCSVCWCCYLSCVTTVSLSASVTVTSEAQQLQARQPDFVDEVKVEGLLDNDAFDMQLRRQPVAFHFEPCDQEEKRFIVEDLRSF